MAPTNWNKGSHSLEEATFMPKPTDTLGLGLPESHNLGTCLVDPDTKVIFAADAAIRNTLKKVNGSHDSQEISSLIPSFSEKTKQAFQKIGRWQEFEFESTVAESCEGSFPARIRVIPLLTDSSEILLVIISAVGTNIDGELITDAVTGLPDRRALEHFCRLWQSGVPTEPTPHAVLFLDIDDFKQVNDLLGHAAGDQVLAELAKRWKGCIREEDLIARYGGDEFVVLVKQVSSRREVEPIVKRLSLATQSPIEIGGETLKISVTIGMALAEGTTIDLAQTIAAADIDMYATKKQ